MAPNLTMVLREINIKKGDKLIAARLIENILSNFSEKFVHRKKIKWVFQSHRNVSVSFVNRNYYLI